MQHTIIQMHFVPHFFDFVTICDLNLKHKLLCGIKLLGRCKNITKSRNIKMFLLIHVRH